MKTKNVDTNRLGYGIDDETKDHPAFASSSSWFVGMVTPVAVVVVVVGVVVVVVVVVAVVAADVISARARRLGR